MRIDREGTYTLDTRSLEAFLREFLPQLSARSLEVHEEFDDQEGVIYLRWIALPDGEEYTLEIDPEHNRTVLAFRCRNVPLINTGDSFFHEPLLDALNAVNLRLEQAHFFLDEGVNPPVVTFVYALPVDENTLTYAQLRRMLLETLHWVSCITPPLRRVARGRLSYSEFVQWLDERPEYFFQSVIGENIQAWVYEWLGRAD